VGTGRRPAGGIPPMSITDPAGDPRAREIDDFASDVLDVVELIPPGHVMSYGDIAEYLGRYGPRRVGKVMSTHGGAVPWWRVIHSDGSMVPGHERAALRQYRKEGTPLRPSADGSSFRVDMGRARWRGLEASPRDPGAPDLGPGDRIPDDFPLPGSGAAH
jgi:alkylated DNA nucleotide flippase Atl1